MAGTGPDVHFGETHLERAVGRGFRRRRRLALATHEQDDDFRHDLALQTLRVAVAPSP